MRFASLGSGSEGNGLVVESGTTRVLIDCGFSITEAQRRLSRLGLTVEDLSAILVTHEHSDHIGGVARLANNFDVSVFCTFGTQGFLSGDVRNPGAVREIDSHDPFCIGDLEVFPFPVPHDAREPVQYVVGDGEHRLGVLTDFGHVTSHIETSLSGCDALVLECNHDLPMLMNGPYPQQLKQRVAGKFGHIDNATAAQLLRDIDTSALRHVVAAHLSQQNNTPQLARQALAGALGCTEDWIHVADQPGGFSWLEL